MFEVELKYLVDGYEGRDIAPRVIYDIHPIQ